MDRAVLRGRQMGAVRADTRSRPCDVIRGAGLTVLGLGLEQHDRNRPVAAEQPEARSRQWGSDRLKLVGHGPTNGNRDARGPCRPGRLTGTTALGPTSMAAEARPGI